MLKKYSVLSGIIISISLLLIATTLYPGGSEFDKTSIGYSWKTNYISNLFGEKAINGADNGGRFWAIAGMLFLSASFAVIFIKFSKKIPVKSAANVIKYTGVISMIFTFLIATPLHDLMVSLSSTIFLIGLFYVTVFIYKSRLHFLKFICSICLLVFYSTLYIYGFGQFLEFLPIMQKITFVVTITTIISLEYFTRKEDFLNAKSDNNVLEM